MKDITNLKENIRLNVEVLDWKEAITKAGEILLNSGYINEKYINEMIEAVENLGPYIVISPHIALAHAKPSNNVYENGISMITLKNPVEFGHEYNDPVDIVFALCSKSSENHLNFLKELTDIISNENIISIIRNADDPTELSNIF
ncbi:MAG: PTS sugar transporter subunit IIA [Tissierellales bacterium]|nr:PTS sugar transporter subunit IIA [Tissierellales bacterium]